MADEAPELDPQLLEFVKALARADVAKLFAEARRGQPAQAFVDDRILPLLKRINSKMETRRNLLLSP